MKKYILLCILMVFSMQANAIRSEYGSGLSSCGSWIEDRGRTAYYIKMQWVLGYVSAYGDYGPENLIQTDADAMSVFIDNYCRQNPLKNIDDATTSLVEALKLKNNH